MLPIIRLIVALILIVGGRGELPVYYSVADDSEVSVVNPHVSLCLFAVDNRHSIVAKSN
jgi:hypothetical protein